MVCDRSDVSHRLAIHPLELLDKGDAWIAKLLLEKGSVR